MYKLENNVAWTNNLIEAFKHGTTRCQVYLAGGFLITESGSYLTTENNLQLGAATQMYNEDNRLVNATMEDFRYVPNVGLFGQATARKLEVNLKSIDETIDLENKEFEFKIGADYNGSTYYINYGKFIVNEAPENDDTNGNVKIVAYDYMIKFNKPFNPPNNLFPCTMLRLFQYVCEQAGVEAGSQSFANSSFTVSDNQFEGMQLRDVLKHIAKSAFSWARIGQDNKCYLDLYANPSVAHTEVLTNEEYKVDAFKKANKYFGPVNKVTFGDTDIEGQEESVEDTQSIAQNGLREIKINDNYFAYTPEKRNALIQAGTRLFGLKYIPIQQMELIGLVYLDCTDLLQIFDMENNEYQSRLWNHTITYAGYVSDKITTESTSLNEEEYKPTYSNTETSYLAIVVDRNKKQISAVVQEVSDLEQSTASLVLNKDSILSTVTYVNNNKTNINKISTIEQKADNILLEVKTIANENLLLNSNFATGDYKNWTKDGNPTTLAVSNVAREQKRWLRNKLTDTTIRHQGIYQQRDYKLQANTKYTLSFLAFYDSSVNSSAVLVNFRCYDSSNTVLLDVWKGFDTTRETTLYNTTFAIGDYDVAKFRVAFYGRDYTTYDYYITDIKLEEGEYVTPWIDNTADDIKSMINLSPESVKIESSKINITASDIIDIIAGNTINLTSKNIVISSTNFSVSASGSITAKDGTIGGWTIGEYKISGGDGTNTKVAVMQLPRSTTTWVFAAGGTSHSSYADCPFRVDKNGNLYATSAEITGKITSTSGTIGGWTIGEHSLSNTGSDYMVFVGDGTNENQDFLVVRQGTSAPYTWPFVVHADGSLSAKKGTIGAITITDQGLCSYGNSNYVGMGLWKQGVHNYDSSSVILHAGGNSSHIGDAYFRLLADGDVYLNDIHIEDRSSNAKTVVADIFGGNSALSLRLNNKNAFGVIDAGNNNIIPLAIAPQSKQLTIGDTSYNYQVGIYNGRNIYTTGNTNVMGYIMTGLGTTHHISSAWDSSASLLDFFVDETYVGSVSDRRLKKDIKQLGVSTRKSVPQINNLIQAISECPIYEFKADNRGGKISVGIIAQDLLEKCKEYNIENPFDYEIISTVQYNLENEEKYYIINYEQYLLFKNYILEKQLNELQAQINEIKEKLNG